MKGRAGRILIFGFFILISSFAHGQISSSRLIKEGDGYFNMAQYRAALRYYQEAGNSATWNKDIKLRVGICQFEINRLEEAIRTLNGLVSEGKTEPTVYLYIAKANQHLNQFEAAIRYYKQYLRKEKTELTRRDWVKDEIKRCANGQHLKYGEETAYVENLGAVLNTLEDEIAPQPSPTYQDRLYFSSNRSESIGAKRLPSGITDSKYGIKPFDIYSIQRSNGDWEVAIPMAGDFNTDQHDIILDFSPDGQIGYLYRGDHLAEGSILTDTFQVDQEGNSGIGIIEDPLKPGFGDQDLFIFHDSILLFSSARPGGFGGFDLYVSVYRFGKWQVPMNLGPEINSFYDERHPYLASNGKTLFFSSNNLQSSGGLDIFRSDYSYSTGDWTGIQNLGIPVNSSADDIHFELSADGLSAYMASDRKSGYGGFDLYSVYFKNQVKEHLQVSDPASFYQQSELIERKQQRILNGDIGTVVEPELLEAKEYYVSDLYYAEDDVIITPQNIKKLDLITNMLLIYPKIEIELICHEATDITSAYALYFSMKKVEKARDYLMRKGVDGNRVHLKGAGNYFPIHSTGKMSPLINKLNRRIEVRFHNTDSEPIRIYKEKQQLPDNLEQYEGYESLTKDLYYMVQIASTKQMLQSPILESQKYAVIEYAHTRRQYRYLVGIAIHFDDAKPILQSVKSKGFEDAFIVPFIDGMRIERNEILDYSDQYPDLLNLFEK